MNGELIDHLLDLSGTQPVFVLSYLNPGARSSASLRSVALLGLLDRVKADRHVLFTDSKETANTNDHGIDLAIGIEQIVIDIANLAVGFVIDGLFVPVSDCEA